MLRAFGRASKTGCCAAMAAVKSSPPVRSLVSSLPGISNVALPMLIFPLPYYITHAEFRYRLNLDPLMTILAAYALGVLFDREKGRQCRP